MTPSAGPIRVLRVEPLTGVAFEIFGDVIEAPRGGGRTVHDGTAVDRWNGDMLQVGLDPQDHGRERSPASGYTMEWLMAPGDLSPPTNVRFRYTEQEAWLEYGEEPWMDFAVRVDPPEAFAAELWSDGGTTFY